MGVLIPVFALGRAQELILILGLLWGLGGLGGYRRRYGQGVGSSVCFGQEL